MPTAFRSPSRVYFSRNHGRWTWETDFKITNWSLFWRSDLPIARKILFATFILSQICPGRYVLLTELILREDSPTVDHRTQLRRFGTTFMRSQKQFQLAANGVDLTLTGFEYFWPRLRMAVPFEPLKGSVDASTTSASYEMPLFGTRCECRTFLGRDEGRIEIENSWLRGRFTLTLESLDQLRERFS